MPEFLQLSENETLFVLPRGGLIFTQPVKRLESADLPMLDACAARWPQENREPVTLIQEQVKEHPESVNWLACETSFFTDLPEPAAEYALPVKQRELGLRRFGADGLFHAWAARQFPDAKRLVSIHLGGGTTLAALHEGKAVDTSAGYSLLEGLPGLTTCGDLDPSLILLLNEQGLLPDEIEKLLYTQSGWQALCSIPLTFSKLLNSNEKGVELARSMYFHSLVKNIGAMLASLGGADLIFLGAESPEECEPLVEKLSSHFAASELKFELAHAKREIILREILKQC